MRRAFAIGLIVLATWRVGLSSSQAAGVTLITHGFEETTYPQWVTAMAEAIPGYPSFPGTNYSIYRMTLTYDRGYRLSFTNVAGGIPSMTDSGEIIVELDWSQLSGDLLDDYASTYYVAYQIAAALMQPNLAPELNGHSLVELPIHLIGHSRGGSLVAEISRQLGTNGLWVDQVTCLDAYPLGNDGDSDPSVYQDAPASKTYANVVFADNYWQNLSGFGVLDGDPWGESITGAYDRHLTDLLGGYNDVDDFGDYHSNVHLWYFGTVDTRTPASDGAGGASITSYERSRWWEADEQQGMNAGFYYSVIGGGNRLSASPAVIDGYNQYYDIGAGQTNPNRTALTSNNGIWPNLIKMDRADTNEVLMGKSLSVVYYFQWVSNGTATISFYLDDDLNPLNGNEAFLGEINYPSTSDPVGYHARISLVLFLPFSNISPGWHSIFGKITGGGQSRYLYAPEWVYVVSNQQPTLGCSASSGAFQVTVNAVVGQTIVLQGSADLVNWQPVGTNTMSGSIWLWTDNSSHLNNQMFYRAVLSQ